MTPWRMWIVLVWLIAGSLGRAAETNSLLSEGVAEFKAAYAAWDADRFAAAAERFRAAATNAPGRVAPLYWLGTAEFHRCLQLRGAGGDRTNATAAEAAHESAMTALAGAVRVDPHDAECHAMLGTLYGLKIGGNVLRAAYYGPQVAKHRKQAMTWGADNPRVQYLFGMAQFHTAKSAADVREALATLQTAERLFAAEAGRAAGPLEPRWGYGSCLTFLGQAWEKLGERTQAAAAYRQALEHQSTDHLARTGLDRVTRSP